MKWKVGISKIHGNGVFATQNIKVNEDIGISIPMISDTSDGRLFERNTFGLLINHSTTPNAKTSKIGKDWHFVAIKPIKENEEILVNYKNYESNIDREFTSLGRKVTVI